MGCHSIKKEDAQPGKLALTALK